MTKHTAFAADDAITAAAVTSQPGRRFTSYPPPTRARGGCRVAAAAAAARQATDPGAVVVAVGSLPELVPRHADLDFENWMVRLSFDLMPRLLCLRCVCSSPPDLT
jgi:trehalose 6-phosphate phosphatase